MLEKVKGQLLLSLEVMEDLVMRVGIILHLRASQLQSLCFHPTMISIPYYPHQLSFRADTSTVDGGVLRGFYPKRKADLPGFINYLSFIAVPQCNALNVALSVINSFDPHILGVFGYLYQLVFARIPKKDLCRDQDSLLF